mmetsp:Transcript_31813/g.64042  ORF Transcript_31813/g.64042 Transcript_31813/m.64042 type:complete len:633 (+) Transcript_31813:114-2012(+)
MKLSAVALSLLTSSAANAQQAAAGTAAEYEYKRMSQLRGASLSSPLSPLDQFPTIKHIKTASVTAKNASFLSAIQVQDEDEASLLKECTALTSGTDCDSHDKCTWCKAGAVPNECVPITMAGRLPAGVFQCSKSSFGANVARSELTVKESLAAKAQELIEEFEKVMSKEGKSSGKKESFELKQGVTLTLSTDEVDKNFCDANSPLSLAGYVNIQGSQYDTQNDKNLFYWMFEKRTTSLVPKPYLDEEQEKPTPLVIWLTGGPGCSSSLALLTENGPCTVNSDGLTTAVNPYSWTESAHVIWLDQPADVGYSYGQENDSNEEMISEDAYYFLQAFFKSEAGSKYKDSPLFIVGESYGGHYAPAIAHRIWRGNKDLKEGLLHLNLSGLAVGNGLTNPEEQYQWYAEMAFKNSHGIEVIDESTYNMMKGAEPMCTKGIHQCNKGDGMLNSFACQAAFAYCNMALTTPYRATGLNPYDIRKPCGDNPLCYDFSHIEKFMNEDSTKEALHVKEHDPTWQTCNMLVNMEFHTDWMKDFSPYVADLLNDDIPSLIYAGDVDFICNYLGNRAWTLNLEWNHKAEFNGAEEKDWNGGGGLVRSANGLTFLQVYDAGHMVPSDQPENALKMITQFLNGEELV